MQNLPPPPGGAATSQKAPEPPPVACGSFWTSPYAWYERHKSKKAVFGGDYFKKVIGLSVTYVASVTTKITLGWEHKTLIGGATNVIGPFDNKINVGFVFNIIAPLKKSEETKGNKSEKTLGGKVSHVRGSKKQFIEKTAKDAVAKERKTHKLKEHITAMDKVLSTLIEMEIKDLERDQSLIELKADNVEQEYKSLDGDIDKWKSKVDSFKGESAKLREECDTAEEKYSATCKNLASAAMEIEASATLERNVRGDAKFIAGSLMKIGAALTKAG
jgi:hypothetical protein